MSSANPADEYNCDLILSTGSNCRPAINLKLNNLREFSSPLDYMMNYSLDTVIHLFRDGFKDFFSEYEIDSETPKGAVGMRRVNDTKNHIVSIHHFPEDVPMDESYPLFIEKMSARAERLEHYLQAASRIVLVSDRTDPKEDMCDFLRAFSGIYPHLNIRLINMRHDENAPYDSYRQESVFAEDSLSYIEYIFNDTDHGMDGNTSVWSQILSNYVITSCV